jgi:competence protein ComEA
MRLVVVAAIALTLVAGAGLVFARLHASPADVAVVEETPPPARTPEPTVLVDVVGAVAHPGVYRLAAGARVLDALLAAGGMTGEADLIALNKATPLRDGMRIYVPRPGEAVPAGSLGSATDRTVDLNRATAAELQTLPGVGATTAARIVRSREAKAFTKVDELQTRGLVTPRVFADIRDLVSTR